jgi:hypothetical protein
LSIQANTDAHETTLYDQRIDCAGKVRVSGAFLPAPMPYLSQAKLSSRMRVILFEVSPDNTCHGNFFGPVWQALKPTADSVNDWSKDTRNLKPYLKGIGPMPENLIRAIVPTHF